ncbi:MAG: histidine kinase [Bacteroidota bacterium]
MDVIVVIISGAVAIAALVFVFTQRQQLQSHAQEIKSLNAARGDLQKSKKEQDTRIQDQDATIADQISVISSLQEKFAEQHAELQQKTGEIAERDRQLAEKNQLLTESRLEKLNFELSPHAFKNTLNTIKGMALRMNMATEMLTELLNYMLYETKKKRVSLAEEIQFIDRYISMNELMIPGWVKIERDFSEVQGQWAERMGIAPLITIYFAENAFKHARQDDKDCFIKFRIHRTGDDEIVYTVTNKRYLNTHQDQRSGIGSSNLNERLALLYAERYTLEARPLGEMFVSELTLKLESHENPVPDRG